MYQDVVFCVSSHRGTALAIFFVFVLAAAIPPLPCHSHKTAQQKTRQTTKMRATTKISQHKSVSLHVYIFYTLCDKQKKGLFWLFCSAQPPENKLPAELPYETLHLKASRFGISNRKRSGGLANRRNICPPPLYSALNKKKGLDAQQVNSNIYTHARARQRELQADLFHALITVAGGGARTQLIFVMHFWRVLSTHDAPIPLP
eukprot:GEMP01072181.1.p1 GENE.GEMP01072181.1~~GEMP01072181.1.p1  ORF type:complete len:203 (-),score=1.67 GEMP01072181.1:120-728(-)